MLAFFLLLPSVPAFAQGIRNESYKSWTFETLAREETLRLEGYHATASFILPLPSTWQPSEDGLLTLEYVISPRTLSAATLAVRLNEQAITTINVPSERGSIVVRLPLEFLRVGDNQLELMASLPLPEDAGCVVPNHPDRWLEFAPESRAELALIPSAGELSLADFPNQFEVLDDGIGADILYVLPDNPDSLELSALASVAFAIAQGTTRSPKGTVTTVASFAPGTTSGSTVLIGAADRNPFVTTAESLASQEVGWLHLAHAPWSEGTPMLTVSGPDSLAVAQAAGGLANYELRSTMIGVTAQISDPPPITPHMPAEAFTLADLGHPERIVRGTGVQSLVYTFDLPFAWSPQNGQLNLHFGHSRALYPETSALTALLNDHPLAIIPIGGPESDSHIVALPISREFFRPGRNLLSFAFDFSIPEDRCGVAVPEGFWGSIRPETLLTIPHGGRGGKVDLRDFPYFFASESDMADLAIVLPQQDSVDGVSVALELIDRLSLSRSRVGPRLLRAEDGANTMYQSHLIVLGDISKQPLVDELNPHLAVPLRPEQVPLGYGLRVPTDSPNLGVIQVLRSPWTLNRAVVVITGSTEIGYMNAGRVLADPAMHRHLNGQLAVVSESEASDLLQIASRHVPDIRAVPGLANINHITSGVASVNRAGPAVVIPLVAMLLLAVVTAFGLRWHRRHQASQSGGH